MTTRTDLPYLRRRSRPKQTSTASGAPTTSAVSDFLAGRSVRPGRDRPTPPAPPASAPPPTPAAPVSGGSALDLGSSAAPATRTPPARPTSSSLDLGSSEPAAPSRRPASSSLDLSGGSAAGSAAAGSGRHTREESYDLRLPTITEHERRVLGAADRVVHLTRMQSAVGRLRIEPALGTGEHLDLGCALETSQQRESIVLGTLNRQGPDPRRPMVRCGGQGVEIDLRRIHSLSRFLILAVTPRLPGGTLVITTYGGSRMEIPLRTTPTLGAQALLTAYVVQGRLILRAELDPFSGTLQQVCGAYGYTDLTWRDPATPLI